MIGRKTDTERRLWFRSARVFASQGRWYFHTREGIDMGPYDTQFAAEVEAEMLKSLLLEQSSGADGRQVIREFLLDSFEMGRPLTPKVKSADSSLGAD